VVAVLYNFCMWIASMTEWDGPLTQAAALAAEVLPTAPMEGIRCPPHSTPQGPAAAEAAAARAVSAAAAAAAIAAATAAPGAAAQPQQAGGRGASSSSSSRDRVLAELLASSQPPAPLTPVEVVLEVNMRERCCGMRAFESIVDVVSLYPWTRAYEELQTMNACLPASICSPDTAATAGAWLMHHSSLHTTTLAWVARMDPWMFLPCVSSACCELSSDCCVTSPACVPVCLSTRSPCPRRPCSCWSSSTCTPPALSTVGMRCTLLAPHTAWVSTREHLPFNTLLCGHVQEGMCLLITAVCIYNMLYMFSECAMQRAGSQPVAGGVRALGPLVTLQRFEASLRELR
jgi:hypothetical protein